MKTSTILFTFTIAIICMVVGFTMVILGESQSYDKEVDCFDGHDNLIVGQTCVKDHNPYEIWILLLTAGVLILLFAGAINLEEAIK